MNHPEHLVVYCPTQDIIDRIQQNGELVSEWTDDTERELLFSLDEPLFRTRNFNRWLLKQTRSDSNIIMGRSNPNEVEDWIKSDKSVEDELFIDDLISEEAGDIADVIRNTSNGGDIRKYILSGVDNRFTIDFSLGRSQEVTSTGMEPLPVDDIDDLIEYGCLSDKPINTNKFQYLKPSRIQKWATNVRENWSVECGAHGRLCFPENGGFSGELSGFVVFEADKNIEMWCREQWCSNGSRSYPYIRPDEFEVYTDTEPGVPRDAIQMLWY